MTSSPHRPYVGYTHATMAGTKGSIRRDKKPVSVADWSLQLDSMKLESLVIAVGMPR